MKLTINNFIAGASLMMALAAPVAEAVPAYPGPVTYHNADGSTVTVRLHGDEWFNYATTPDGSYPVILDSQGIYRYATINADGKAVASDVRVVDGMTPTSLTYGRDQVMDAIRAEVPKAVSARAKAASWDRKGTTEKIGGFPVQGSPRVLVVLINYKDVKMSSSSIGLFEQLLNGANYDYEGATGSAREYFAASSGGKFTPQFDIYGPVTVSKNRADYGTDVGGDRGNDSRGACEMINEALRLLDDQIDYSLYDCDHDGQVDNIYAFYAGQGQADGGPATSIWPHAWYLRGASKALSLDGVYLDRYATSCELSTAGSDSPRFTGIGTFTHEFSHVMGLPDLYDTDYSGAFTPGEWDIMSAGNYNNNSNTPPLYSGYERYVMGWLTPTVLNSPENVTLRPASGQGYDDVRVIRTASSNEYYILENRQREGWDAYLPYHGMLVWHIEYDPSIWAYNKPNDNASRQRIDIVEADDVRSDRTVSGDPFPGTASVTSFTDFTTPSMVPRCGGLLDCPITYIKEENNNISFLFKGGELDEGDYVKILPPTELTWCTARVNWEPVEAVDSYYVNLTHPSGTRLLTMEPVDTTSMLLTALDHDTEYQYTVSYYAEGRLVGTSSTVTTPEPPLDMRRPTAYDATEIDGHSFVASWDALNDAATYSVDIFTPAPTGPTTVKEAFDDGVVSERWTSNIDRFIDRQGYYSKVPAAFLETTGQYIMSPEFYGEIEKLSFWVRNTATPGSSVLRVKVRPTAADNWVTVLDYSPTYSKTTKRLTSEDIGEGMHQFMIEFEYGTTAVALDDISVSVADDIIFSPVEDLAGINAGEVLSLKVEGLRPSTEYSYTVTGHSADSTMHSLPSQPMFFATPELSSVEDMASSSVNSSVQVNGNIITVSSPILMPVTLCNLTGQVLYSSWVSPASPCSMTVAAGGVYFVKAGNDNFKIIVR